MCPVQGRADQVINMLSVTTMRQGAGREEGGEPSEDGDDFLEKMTAGDRVGLTRTEGQCRERRWHLVDSLCRAGWGPLCPPSQGKRMEDETKNGKWGCGVIMEG